MPRAPESAPLHDYDQSSEHAPTRCQLGREACIPHRRLADSTSDLAPGADAAARAFSAVAEARVARSAVEVAGHTYTYRDRSLGDALDELAGLGFARVDLWLGHATDGSDEVARALRERGLEAAALSAGGIYTADTDAAARAFELAQALAVPVVVACVAPSVLDWVAERVPPRVTLCVENHWYQPLATAREVAEVLSRRTRLAACVDTGHAILAGEAPERFVAILGPQVGHVHLKDAGRPAFPERIMGRRLRARLLPRPRPVVPGTGALDVGRVRSALTAAGFEGAVALEHEGSEPTAALGALLRQWTASVETPAAAG